MMDADTRRARRIGVALMVAGAVVMLALAKAQGHGTAADWIVRGDFENSSGTKCCHIGRDCNPIAGEHARQNADGTWSVKWQDQWHVMAPRDVHASRDRDFWLCADAWQARPRCLFVLVGS